jgi:putative PIN family toxin of toxin-antitoxin system
MRLVVDTNVFVSAAVKQISWPGMTLRWLDRYGSLLKTAAIEAEILAVLNRPRLTSKITPSFVGNVRRPLARAECVDVTEPIKACRDPDDDKFLSLAVNGRADVIISGDADLLVLGVFRGAPIINPARFASAHLLAPDAD